MPRNYTEIRQINLGMFSTDAKSKESQRPLDVFQSNSNDFTVFYTSEYI